ncbi:VOC family protein [Dactylosporangium sp. NPDC051541]|uniref:VOC family protein n=1 Tax=Dactylosporangium sp. NPDC051541 TaxID=3363977 RepID=UPI003789A9D8
MGDPVVHFEISGKEPARLRDYYGELFDWRFNPPADAATERVSAIGNYHFVQEESAGLNGGVCGGDGYPSRVTFYVNVADVEVALAKAESLGGTRIMGPEPRTGSFTVGHFQDPEGNVVGVAGPTA